MEPRSHESPMDFQWGDKGGPRDPASPFPISAVSMLRNQSGFGSQKRTFSVFNSQDTPSTPMRQPSPQKSLFSQAKPAQEFRTPSFTHLREPPVVDFSSGPENQSSPENADNEDTPEQPTRDGLAKGNGAITLFRGHKSPTKTSFSGIFGNHISPGRGEIPRRHYTDAIARRVHKRRRRDHDKDNSLAQRRPSYDSDSEERSRPSSSEGNTTQQRPPQDIGFIPSIFSFIETHPQLPHILSFYAQLLLNVFLVFFFIYIIYSFWSTIRQDVDMKSEEAAAETLAEMAACARNFVENRCDRDSRVPAMEVVCNNWEKCMNRDPSMVGRARVSAHTFAEIFNSFVEPISYKAMIFCLTIVFGCVAISNFAFGFFRNKAHPPPHVNYMHHPGQQQPQMHFPSGEQYYTPYQSRAGMANMDTGASGMGIGMRSPSKRIGYR